MLKHLSSSSSVATLLVFCLLGCATVGHDAGRPGANGTPVNPARSHNALVGAERKSMTQANDESSTNTEVLFGRNVVDEQRWLENESSPSVQQWLDKEDEYARASLQSMGARASFAARLREVVYVGSNGLPMRRGNRLFTSVRKATDEKSVYYVQDGNGPPRVLLDPHTMSVDGSLRVTGLSPSNDGHWVGFLEQPNSADESILKVVNATTGVISKRDVITNLRHTSISWNHDSTGFYYTWLPPSGTVPVDKRAAYAEVRFHALGTDPEKDALIFPSTGDASKFVGAWESFDGTFTLATIHSGWDRSQVFLRDNRVPQSGKSDFVELAPGLDALFSVAVHRDHLYVLTNWGAPRFRLLRTRLDDLDVSKWQEVVAQADGVLENFDVLNDHLVLQYSRDAQSELQVRKLDGTFVRVVPLPAIGSVSGLSALPNSNRAYFQFSSFTHPTEVHELDVTHAATRFVVRDEVKVEPEGFEVRQEWYRSKDGTAVPMFIVLKRGLELDGSSPVLLTGYGGFASAMTPWFTSSLFPWLERGGVYAVANLRGGNEYGEEWHQAGMLAKKQNVFDDFYAAAEHLVTRRYTSHTRLGIQGASNGGLLVGVAMTQRPELFGAVICGVPLLDMLRYHKFGLGRAWIPEYGDPDKAADFEWLWAYSPYHHLEAFVEYPPLLMMSADTDDRVDPMHARKFVARMLAVAPERRAQTLLRVEKNAGHGGADLRQAFVERRADEYAFLWHYLVGQK
jgi:prolyl oligopeptidase